MNVWLTAETSWQFSSGRREFCGFTAGSSSTWIKRCWHQSTDTKPW